MKPLTGIKLTAIQLSFENSELFEQMTGSRYRVQMSVMVFDIVEPHYRRVAIDMVVTSSRAGAEAVAIEQIRREFNAVAVWRLGGTAKVEAAIDDQ